MYKSFLITLILSMACQIGNTQLGRSLQACWVHLDKPFYVVDDVVAYQLYLPPEFIGINATVQTILFNADGQALWYSYQQNNEKSNLSGVLALSEQLSTDWYYLSFRVWDTNLSTERVLVQVPLAIYNDHEEITPTRVSQQEPARLKDPVEVENKELTITLSLRPEKPRQGEEVELILKATNRRGKPVPATFSLSINDWSQLSTSLAMGMDNLHAGDSLRVVTPSYLTNDVYWQGILLDKDQKALPSVSLLLPESKVHTDERGRFILRYPSGNQRYEVDLTFEDGAAATTQFMPQRGRLVMGELFYTPAAFRYLEANRQRREIFELLQRSLSPLTGIEQNQVNLNEEAFTLIANQRTQHNWRYSAVDQPIHPSCIWQTDIRTDATGEAKIIFVQPNEKTAFRIDVIGQSEEGQRARANLLYRLE
ncbi:MAG: hypothetical protein AAGJ93_15370 [Bacteroidota bacterium]